MDNGSRLTDSFTGRPLAQMARVLVLALLLPLGAQAADINRANVSANLEFGTAWTGGSAPTNSDVAVFGNIGVAAATNALGADASWQGIRITVALGRVLTINRTAPATLTLGSAGIDLTQARFGMNLYPDILLDAAQTWAVTNSKTVNVYGAISGGAGSTLTKSDLGTLTLAGSNTYGGGTLLNAGTLNINNSNALGTATFTINGGKINNTSGAAVIVTNDVVINGDFSSDNNNNPENIQFSANVSLGTAPGASRTMTANLAGTASLTFAGAITNGTTATGIVKQGPGTIALTGNNTFSGGVILGAGGLNINSSSTGTSGSLGTGVLIISNATVLSTQGVTAKTMSNTVVVAGNFTMGNNINNAPITVAGPMDLDGGTRVITILQTNGNTVISGVISNGALTVGAGDGTLVLSGNNTYEGDTTLNNTANLWVGSDANLGVGTNVTMNQNSVLTATANMSTSKRFTLTGAGQQFFINSGKTLTLNGVVGGTAQSPVKGGPGTLVLNASNEFADTSVFLVKDGKLKLGNDAALNGTTLKFNPAGSSLDNSKGSAMIATGFQGLQMTSGFTFTGTDDLDLSVAPAAFVQTANSIRTISVTAKTLTIGGILSTGTDYAGTSRLPGGLNKSGAGTLVIRGASDYTNGTTVTAGTLRLASNDALPPGGPVTLSGGTLDAGDFSHSPASLDVTATSTLAVGAGQLAFTNQTAEAWAGGLAITGELGRYTLRFQPVLTAGQLAQINYAGGGFYQSPDGYVRPAPKGAVMSVR